MGCSPLCVKSLLGLPMNTVRIQWTFAGTATTFSRERSIDARSVGPNASILPPQTFAAARTAAFLPMPPDGPLHPCKIPAFTPTTSCENSPANRLHHPSPLRTFLHVPLHLDRSLRHQRLARSLATSARRSTGRRAMAHLRRRILRAHHNQATFRQRSPRPQRHPTLTASANISRRQRTSLPTASQPEQPDSTAP